MVFGLPTNGAVTSQGEDHTTGLFQQEPCQNGVGGKYSTHTNNYTTLFYVCQYYRRAELILGPTMCQITDLDDRVSAGLLSFYLMLGYSILYRLQRLYDVATLTISTIFCLFLTRWTALQYCWPGIPSTEIFDLKGTISALRRNG